MRAHHRPVELRAGDLAFGVNLHFTGKTQPVDFRIQRADAVGQGLGQHRHHEPGEIDRCGPVAGLVIQITARAHVVADIGDRHDQAEAGTLGFAVDGVVEIPGVLAIDGHQGQLAQVYPVGDFRCTHLQRHLAGFVQRRFRPLIGNAVAVDRRFHHQRRRQPVTEHGDHPAQRRPVGIGRFGNLAHHQLPVAGITAGVGGNHHVLGDAAVIRINQADATAFAVDADQAIGAPLQHLDDHAFLAAAAIQPGDADHDPVAMQHAAHLVGRQEDVVATGIRAQEAETVFLAEHAAGDQVELVGGTVAATPVHVQLAIAQHCRQTLAQGIETIRRGQAQTFGDGLGLEQAALVGQKGEDRFAAGNGIGVAAPFAFGMGVGCGRRVDVCLAGAGPTGAIRAGTARPCGLAPARGCRRCRRRLRRRIRQPGRRLAAGRPAAALAGCLAGLAGGRVACGCAVAALAGRGTAAAAAALLFTCHCAMVVAAVSAVCRSSAWPGAAAQAGARRGESPPHRVRRS